MMKYVLYNMLFSWMEMDITSDTTWRWWKRALGAEQYTSAPYVILRLPYYDEMNSISTTSYS